MSRVRGVSMNKAPNIIKYPKIIHVKCLETGKVYKAEKMCRNMSIVKSEHIYFDLNFFGRCFEIYDKKLYKNTNGIEGCFFSSGYVKGNFLCINYDEDIKHDVYTYFVITAKTKVTDKIRDGYNGVMRPYMYEYIDNEFISFPFYIYEKYLPLNPIEIKHNYNFIRVTRNEYNLYLNSRN